MSYSARVCARINYKKAKRKIFSRISRGLNCENKTSKSSRGFHINFGTLSSPVSKFVRGLRLFDMTLDDWFKK